MIFRLSTTVPIVLFAASRITAVASTVMLSLVSPTSIRKSRRATCSTASVIASRLICLNPGAEAVT